IGLGGPDANTPATFRSRCRIVSSFSNTTSACKSNRKTRHEMELSCYRDADLETRRSQRYSHKSLLTFS
ncbi:mCG1030692, partial [Mus musculus]